MTVKPDDQQYRAAIGEIDALLDTDPQYGTEDCDRLEFPSVLVESYEDEPFPGRSSSAVAHRKAP